MHSVSFSLISDDQCHSLCALGFDAGATVKILFVLGGPGTRFDSIFDAPPSGLAGLPGETGITATDLCHTFNTPTSLGDSHGTPLFRHARVSCNQCHCAAVNLIG